MRALSNAAGTAVTDTYQGASPWGFNGSHTGLSTQSFGYTGEQQDAEIGMVNLRAREYDPNTARFVQRDHTIGAQNTPTTLNRYSYVLNNPTNLVDPSGHDHCTSYGTFWAGVTAVSSTGAMVASILALPIDAEVPPAAIALIVFTGGMAIGSTGTFVDCVIN